MKKTKLLKYIILGAVAALVATFMLPKRESRKGHPRDYAEIAANGTLRAATEYNSISFYVDGDTLSGFHYELIEAFARDHSLQVAITPEMSFNERLEGLAEGRYDVIAYGLLATSELKDSLLLTAPIVLNRQVLVQRKMDSPDDSLFVRSQLDLAGKTLNVVKGSPSILRIRNLGNEIGHRPFRRRQPSANRYKYRNQLHSILLMGSEQAVSGTSGQPEQLAGTV